MTVTESRLLEHGDEAAFAEQAGYALLLLAVGDAQVAAGHPDEVALRQFRKVLSSILADWLIFLPIQMHTLQEFKATALELEQVDQLVLDHVRVQLGVPREDEEIIALHLVY